MEEVRSYWQVAGITHFCNLFGKPFKLPSFEPEQLEQAFILEIPNPTPSNNNNNHINDTSASTQTIDNNQLDHEHDHDSPAPSEQIKDNNETIEEDDADEEYKPPPRLIQPYQEPQQQQPQIDEQQDLHLLVKLAISLLKPHYSAKISHLNWEHYLRRIIEANWVELERHPSPFRVPIISQDGVELFKNLTFNELSISDKIDIFYALCDYRLWCEDAPDALREYTFEELRHESIGKDSQGYEYWYFSGTRLFKENRELSQDIILRKKRIKELEYELIELEKTRIAREQEEKRKAELERAKQLAIQAREARMAVKRQQEQEASNKRKKQATYVLPPRTGLRERRSSTTSNNNESQLSSTPALRNTRQRAKQQELGQPPSSAQKVTRSSHKGSKQTGNCHDDSMSPEQPRKSPEEECKEELERLTITIEDRAEAWCMQCDSSEDWESFAVKFEKTKSTNEKHLASNINEEILPKIRAIYAKRAAEVRRKEKELLLSLASRRVSTRIISKKAQEEEEERRAKQQEAEARRKREAEMRLKAELEREIRAKKNRFVINGGASSTCSEDGEDISGRYNLRQQPQQQQQPHQPQFHGSDEFEGIIHPEKLSEFYEALELVVDTVRTSKHAWPFVYPVPDTVPGYYDLISEPMDLKKLRTRIEFREYKSLVELEKDFQLIVNNCEKFNGPRNVYTKMVYRLWRSFRKNVQLYLQRDLSMNEYETFIYPPQPKQELPEPEPPIQELNGTSPVDKQTPTQPEQNGTTSNHEDADSDTNSRSPEKLSALSTNQNGLVDTIPAAKILEQNGSGDVVMGSEILPEKCIDPLLGQHQDIKPALNGSAHVERELTTVVTDQPNCNPESKSPSPEPKAPTPEPLTPTSVVEAPPFVQETAVVETIDSTRA